MELAHYRETVERIRDSGVDVIINLTTGPGQRFIPGKDDPKVAAPGTTLMHPLRRVEHILALKPEICSLDLNTMWSGTSAVINSPKSITIMAQAMKEAGSKPEIEVFDSGDIQLAKALIADGVLDSPPLFQIVTGIRYGFEFDAADADLCPFAAARRRAMGGLRHWPYGIPDGGAGLPARRPHSCRP